MDIQLIVPLVVSAAALVGVAAVGFSVPRVEGSEQPRQKKNAWNTYMPLPSAPPMPIQSGVSMLSNTSNHDQEDKALRKARNDVIQQEKRRKNAENAVKAERERKNAINSAIKAEKTRKNAEDKALAEKQARMAKNAEIEAERVRQIALVEKAKKNAENAKLLADKERKNATLNGKTVNENVQNAALKAQREHENAEKAHLAWKENMAPTFAKIKEEQERKNANTPERAQQLRRNAELQKSAMLEFRNKLKSWSTPKPNASQLPSQTLSVPVIQDANKDKKKKKTVTFSPELTQVFDTSQQVKNSLVKSSFQREVELYSKRNEAEQITKIAKMMDNLHENATSCIPFTHNAQTNPKLNNRALVTKNLEYFWMQDERVHIDGDGNCQFSSLSDQLTGRTNLHVEIRALIINEMLTNPGLYTEVFALVYPNASNSPANAPAEYGYTDLSAYILKMSDPSTWGDVITLSAAANVFNRKIYVVTQNTGQGKIQRALPTASNKRPLGVPLILSLVGDHYQSVHLISDQFPKEFWSKCGQL